MRPKQMRRLAAMSKPSVARASWLLALAAAVFLVAAGCSDSEPETVAEPATPTTQPTTTAAPTTTDAPASESETEDEHDHDHESADEHDHDHESEAMDEAGHDHELPEVTGRLLIGDGTHSMLSVIDVSSDTVMQDAFDLGARPTRLYPTKSGRFAIAVATDANDVHVFDGGTYLEPHDDHMDLIKRDVSNLEVDLAGERPVHLYMGSDWAGLFYDGSGDVAFIAEDGLKEDGGSYVAPRINVGSHHGAVVPLDNDLFAVSYRHPDYESDPESYVLPIGAEIVTVDGEVLHQQLGCDGLHGNGGNGTVAVFGCIGGAMWVEAHDSDYHGGFVAAPEGSAEDFRIGTVWGTYGLDHFLGHGRTIGLYVVHPHEGSMELLIPAVEGRSPVDVKFSHDGESFLVIMSNGELRKYDSESLTLQAATSGFLADGVSSDFWERPNMTTAPGAIFVTDPTGGSVLMLEDENLEVVHSWDVDGIPNKIAFVGILDHEDM